MVVYEKYRANCSCGFFYKTLMEENYNSGRVDHVCIMTDLTLPAQLQRSCTDLHKVSLTH